MINLLVVYIYIFLYGSENSFPKDIRAKACLNLNLLIGNAFPAPLQKLHEVFHVLAVSEGRQAANAASQLR